MKKILAIDYGQRNIGLAFTESLIAEPIKPLKITSQDNAIEQIKIIIKEHNPEIIIIGIPEGKLENEVKEFASLVRNTFKLKTILHPETLTTHEAIQKLRHIGAKVSKLKQDHSYAAALILEDYIADQAKTVAI